MAKQIITNNQPRELLNSWDLSAKEWQEFDYLGEQDSEDAMSAQFIKYRGEVYYLGDFVRIVSPASRVNSFEVTDYDGSLKGWHGILTDSYFSGIVIKWVDDNFDSVIVGRAFA